MGGHRAVLWAGTALTLAALCAGTLLMIQPGSSPGSSRPSEPVVAGSTPEAVAGETPAPADLPALGVQFHGTWEHYSRRERAEVLDRIEESGAAWVRLDVGWAMLQPKPGGFDEQWAVPKIDEVMDQLRRRGLKVLVMFWLTPSWATGETDPVLAQYTSPDDPLDYAKAISYAADRWGDVVDAWEVWNEPNLEAFYVGTDPATYVGLLCPAFEAVRRYDRDARVVFGGLMYSDDAWLQKAYEAGAGGCFDVLSLHSYQAPADAPPSTVDTGEVWNLSHLTAVQRTMAANGDDLPVWVTEFGWSVHGNEADTEPWRRGVTEAQQAEYGREAVQLLGRHFPFVKVAFWYKDAVDDSSTDEHQEGYALLDANRRPRPVFRAFADLYGGA
jgi:hypothetical protein